MMADMPTSESLRKEQSHWLEGDRPPTTAGRMTRDAVMRKAQPGDVIEYTPGQDDYKIKDSGKRAEFAGGMVRDTDEGKLRPDLVRDGPMLNRWIIHLTNGALKYDPRNWMLGVNDPATLERAYESADRHYHQWREGDTDEDHAAALFFNVNQVEHYKKEAAEDAPEETRQLSLDSS